ncbi:Peptide transporter ptr1, variant 2 [Trebouxia sp. C0009 RCD-2024]
MVRNKFSGRLTTVVHNAGLSISVTSSSERGDRAAISGNDEVYSYYQAVYTQCFRRLVEGALRCQGLRNVIALSSPGCNLLMQPQLFYEAPGQAKAAMEYLVRFYARKLAPKGIRVNCIIPGAAISTDAWSRIVQHSNMTKDMLEEQIVQATPLRRWVKPSEIGGLAGLLVSDAAALITGQFLIADGGAFLGRAEHYGADAFSPSDLKH